MHATQTKTVRNKYFIVIFIKTKVEDAFIDACRTVFSNIIILDNFKNITLESAAQHLCSVDGSGVSKDYIIKYLNKNNFLICLMNHDDYSLAGFAYGSANSPVKYDWSSFYVNVLCAHNHLKAVGYTLTCILKLMAIEVHKKTRAKTGFVLDSIDGANTIAFYNTQDILPINAASSDLHRKWDVDVSLGPRLKKQMSHIELKIRNRHVQGETMFEFAARTNDTPPMPGENLYELLIQKLFKPNKQTRQQTNIEHPRLLGIRKKITAKKHRRKQQIRELKPQLKLYNDDLDSYDRLSMSEFIRRERAVWYLDDELISSSDIGKLKKRKTRLTKRIKKTKKNKFNDSKNYWNVLRNSSSLSSSSSKQKTK